MLYSIWYLSSERVIAGAGRIDKVVRNGDATTGLHGVSLYLNVDMLHDFML